jgi:hypothetical protein
MDCFRRLLQKRSNIALNKLDYSKFTSAGCLFTDGVHVLAGYQQNKREPSISGLGGKRLPGETFKRTALRETLEELFDIRVSNALLDILEASMEPKNTMMNGKYILLYYSFEDLEVILQYASSYCGNTQLYDDWPESINDLIFNRRYTQGSEVAHLCLLPFAQGITISSDLKSDIKLVTDKNTASMV